MTLMPDTVPVFHEKSWITSNGCVFHPPDTPTCSMTSSASSIASISATSTLPVTSDISESLSSSPSTPFPSSTIVTLPSTTFTSTFLPSSTSGLPSLSSSGTLSSSVTSSGTQGLSTPSSSAFPPTGNAVCAGEGVDASAAGLLASLIIPSAIGLLVWLLFALLRPHFRQVYALREWFPPQDTRPEPLSSSFWAFLFPHVPLVPGVSSDVSDAGQSAQKDAQLFPTDEQLTQRTLFIAFRICLAWTILGLAGALPLYLVSLPCQAEYPSEIVFGGASSMLQDLSLLRLLKLFDSGNAPSNNLAVVPRSILARAPEDDPYNARVRIIVLTALAALAVLLPGIISVVRELNNLVGYRKAWLETKCCNLEMAFLSAKHAPGFKGRGEKEIKDFLVNIGIGPGLKNGRSENEEVPPSTHRRRKTEISDQQSFTQYEPDRRRKTEISDQQSFTQYEPEETLAVDIHSIYTIGDTQRLSSLIDDRDEILENLEVAETRYITSFRTASAEATPEDNSPVEGHSHISRPQPLGSHQKVNRFGNPALASSSRAPTGFVAPSQFYRLSHVRGVNSGLFSGSQPSFAESFSARLTGRDGVRDPTSYRQVPAGSESQIDENGEQGLSDTHDATIPDPRRFGPNHAIPEDEREADAANRSWVDISEAGGPIGTSGNGARASHLREQQSQPFVRPIEGVNFDQLKEVYNEITLWRSRLKAINQEIGEAQREGYSGIAEGTNTKGWMLIGVGLRFLPKVQLIDGRAKEDVRWDVIQDEQGIFDTITYWVGCIVVALLLAVGLAAAAGLALANAPEVAHYLPFLQSLWDEGDIVTGLATIFAPAVAATLFISLALYLVSWASRARGVVSVSGTQMLLFRTTFWILTIVAALWLIAVGALIFAVHPFNERNNESQQVANGSIYMATIALALVLNVAILWPGLLLLQPLRLWQVAHAEKKAITPRQRFRATYPRSYNPSFAIAPCVLAIVFAAIFSLVFPLIGPPVMLLIFLCMLAHRFLIGYVYGRTHSQTGGELSIYMIRRIGTLVSFQPILIGLIFLSREFWIVGGVLMGVGVLVVFLLEGYAIYKTRQPGFSSLTSRSQESVKAFAEGARQGTGFPEPQSPSRASSNRDPRTRGSMASVLEMMSITLAVMPSAPRNRGPLPLPTETIDDLAMTERAARTSPNAPPRLPPLPFTNQDLSALLYAPELLATDPKIWLPNDSAGVAHAEALDLQRYHDLEVILDVQTIQDAKSRFGGRPSMSSRKSS